LDVRWTYLSCVNCDNTRSTCFLTRVVPHSHPIARLDNLRLCDTFYLNSLCFSPFRLRDTFYLNPFLYLLSPFFLRGTFYINLFLLLLSPLLYTTIFVIDALTSSCTLCRKHRLCYSYATHTKRPL
jgi:hypothetical protein